MFEPSDSKIFKPSGFFDKDKKEEVKDEETEEEPVEKIEAD